VVDALQAVARALGVDVRGGSPVRRIRVTAGAVEGVVLESGEAIDARVVAASSDPKTTLLRLLDPGGLALETERRISGYRTGGTTAKVNLALAGRLTFASRPDVDVEFARICGSVDGLERAFDPAKYGRFSESPALDVWVPTRTNPDWAPPGHHVVSILVHFAPYMLEGGWSDAARQRLGDVVVESLSRFAPGVPESLVAREVLTPADIERRYRTTGGHVHHGDLALDQILVRPIPECARFATPIRGLFLAGRGSHPAPAMSGAAGRLAARVIVRGG
jgi:phytoene dehydrogenase-like protein